MKILDFIRGIVRPFLTMFSGLTILGLLLLGRPVPGELWVFFSSVSGWTMAERAIKHALENGKPGTTPTP